MSHYSFLPWLRRGIATTITSADGATGVPLRATVPVDLRITATLRAGGTATEDVHRDVQLIGPGDVAALEGPVIVRTEPRSEAPDFEPNYLAFVEFYDEDAPWRFTPARPDPVTRRLRPWLALVVLAEGEFVDGEPPRGTRPEDRRLGYVTVDDLGLFPPADQLWAWAHVHVNRPLGPGTLSDDTAQVLTRLDQVLAESPDLACSRLLSPRKLAPDTVYTAFVMPTFETGRLAGLGLDPAVAPYATASAWAPYPGRPDGGRFGYYHRWSFRTGQAGDFEYLVRLLQPRPVDARVGRRDLDVRRPGADLPGITDAALGGVLRLGGALRVPQSSLSPAERAAAQRYENWDQPGPHPFQRALADLVNLADDYATGAADGDPDPLVTPPLYGQWHALTNRLLAQPGSGTWVDELNLDPRFRATAGFGTEIVQQHQEDYMAAAWTQIGAVLEANRRIRLAQLAREVAGRWHTRHLTATLAADPAAALALTAPAHARALSGGTTVSHRVATSAVGPAPVSAALRRAVRPGSRVMRRLGLAGTAGTRRPGRLLTRLADGEVTAAPPKGRPAGSVTVRDVLGEFGKVLRDRGLADRLRMYDDGGRPGDRDPKGVDGLPKVPNFEVRVPGDDTDEPKPGDRDSTVSVRYKGALRDLGTVFDASSRVSVEPARPELPVGTLAAAAVAALRPDVTVPRQALAGLHIPERLRPVVVERFVEAMAYPEIDVPMYRPLVDRSTELFLPNLNLIPPNSMTLLETNQRFIEAYLVGLNHEFARELLWREFPTDRRGTYFRQFWDPSAQAPVAGETPAQRRERLRDIPPLHLWSRTSALGGHDHREADPATAEEEVVLVIRGDLLRRYPNAVIYAQRADWRRINGQIDPNSERVLVRLTPAEEAEPPRDKLRLPLYEARVDPDITFLGFDLTAEAARGDDTDPGWFFVIRERPGEPRFGFDIERSGPLNVWNDLAWPDVLPAQARFVPVDGSAPTHHLVEPTTPDVVEKRDQWLDDRPLHWGADLQSAEVAYITYQAPVLVAVHAQEMLRG